MPRALQAFSHLVLKVTLQVGQCHHDHHRDDGDIIITIIITIITIFPFLFLDEENELHGEFTPSSLHGE